MVGYDYNLLSQYNRILTTNMMLIEGSTYSVHLPFAYKIIRALIITITEPKASPNTCRYTPRMFSWVELLGVTSGFAFANNSS